MNWEINAMDKIAMVGYATKRVIFDEIYRVRKVLVKVEK